MVMRAGKKADPDGPEEVEGKSAAECPKVCDASRVMAEQGRAGGTRELGGAVRRMVPGRAEGERSQGLADRSQGEVTGSAAQGGDRGSTHQCGAGDRKTQGRSEQQSEVNRGEDKGLKGANRKWLAKAEEVGEGGWLGS